MIVIVCGFPQSAYYVFVYERHVCICWMQLSNIQGHMSIDIVLYNEQVGF